MNGGRRHHPGRASRNTWTTAIPHNDGRTATVSSPRRVNPPPNPVHTHTFPCTYALDFEDSRQEPAQSVGIPLRHIWVIVWSVAGLVALVAGIIWGSKLGVQFSIALVALKALPVLMLGGLTSVPGAIVAGLIVGAGEKLSEVFLGPFLGGGIENWFAYVLALLFLLVRPQGLFGERIIERV